MSRREVVMSPVDPIRQFAVRHLGDRAVPDDLRRLLNAQWHDAATGRSNPLKDAGVTFLDGDRMPMRVAAVCAGRDDVGATARLTSAQAMEDMLRYSGFVAEDAAGDAIAYWFGPDPVPIETAPLLRFDADGNFSVLPGDGIAEAILVVASHGDGSLFSTLRHYLNEQGLDIAARTIEDVRPRACSIRPQVAYRRLIEAYSADLSAASIPRTGDPVTIATLHRGPEIGPEED
jgi:hypothetical protein